VINSIKTADKCETSDLLMTHSFDDMIMNGEKSSFSGMMIDTGRLDRIEQSVGR